MSPYSHFLTPASTITDPTRLNISTPNTRNANVSSGNGTSCIHSDNPGKTSNANAPAIKYNAIVTYTNPFLSIKPCLKGRPVEFTKKIVVEFTIEYRNSTVFLRLGLKLELVNSDQNSYSGVISALVS